jgi:hypothetical protein
LRQVHASHGQWFPQAHINTSRCPPSAALRTVSSSHGQWCPRASCSTLKVLALSGECATVSASHSQPCSRALINTARCPSRAASQQVLASHQSVIMCRCSYPPYRYGHPGYRYGIWANDVGDDSIDMLIPHIDLYIYCHSTHGQPRSRAQRSASWCPLIAAPAPRAYTRSLVSSTSAVSDTQKHPTHPKHPLTPL